MKASVKKLNYLLVIFVLIAIFGVAKIIKEQIYSDNHNNASVNENFSDIVEINDEEQGIINSNNSISDDKETIDSPPIDAKDQDDVILEEIVYFESKEETYCHYSYKGHLFVLDELFADDPDKDNYRLCVYISSSLNSDTMYILFSIHGTNRILYEGKGYRVSEDGNVFRIIGSYVDNELNFPYIGLDYKDDIDNPDLQFFCAEHHVCTIDKGNFEWFYHDFDNANMVYPQFDYLD